MRIYCPKCNVGYEIDEALIPEKGKKLRCSYCNTVFTAHREDLINVLASVELSEADESPQTEETQPESQLPNDEAKVEQTVEDDAAPSLDAVEPEVPDAEIKDIFQRLSEETENLFKAEQELPAAKRAALKTKQKLGLNKKSNRRLLVLIILCLLGLVFYRYRFGIVRTMPWLNPVFKTIGVQAVIPGEGLEFQNIVWEDFEDDYVRKLEVKGFIANVSSHEIKVPQIHVEMLDQDGGILQAVNQNPSIKSLNPGGRLAISIIIKKPSPLTKYVFLTFIERSQGNR